MCGVRRESKGKPWIIWRPNSESWELNPVHSFEQKKNPVHSSYLSLSLSLLLWRLHFHLLRKRVWGKGYPKRLFLYTILFPKKENLKAVKSLFSLLSFSLLLLVVLFFLLRFPIQYSLTQFSIFNQNWNKN